MSETLRLSELIEITRDDVERALAEQAKDENSVALVQRQLVGYAASLAADELNKALDIEVIRLLATAWAGAQAVRDAARRSTESNERTVVTLGSHEVASEQHPVVTLTMAQVPLPELRLTIDLLARFKSVALAIAGPAIRGIAPGEASLTARLRYGDTLLKEVARPLWGLPPRVSFGDGVPVVAG
jgi:hypothetical protein